jgi:hypothetical protein
MTHRLTFPAPRRISEQVGHHQEPRTGWQLPKKPGRTLGSDLVLHQHLVDQATFATRPWAEGDVLRLVSNGGWFDFGTTEFENKATREFAMQAQAVQAELLGGV